MTEIRFYQLSKKNVLEALPEILGKALARDFKIVIKTTDEDSVKEIDNYLWTYNNESFLPHGYKKNKNQSDQPIWITAGDDNPNNANMLVLINNTEVKDLSKTELCCKIFTGSDKEILDNACSTWDEYKKNGFNLSYFKQDDNGKWHKKS